MVISIIHIHKFPASFSIINLRIVLNYSMSRCYSCTLEIAIINGCILLSNYSSMLAIWQLRYFACSIMIILKVSLFCWLSSFFSKIITSSSIMLQRVYMVHYLPCITSNEFTPSFLVLTMACVTFVISSMCSLSSHESNFFINYLTLVLTV